MKRSKGVLISGLCRGMSGLLLIAALAGCATTQSNPQAGFNLNPYEIKLTTEPDPPAAGAQTMIRADVSGEPQLTTRAEISYEVKKLGSEQREDVTAERKLKGVYTANYTFKEAGTYQIVVHIVTRAIHQVKTVEITVK